MIRVTRSTRASWTWSIVFVWNFPKGCTFWHYYCTTFILSSDWFGIKANIKQCFRTAFRDFQIVILIVSYSFLLLFSTIARLVLSNLTIFFYSSAKKKNHYRWMLSCPKFKTLLNPVFSIWKSKMPMQNSSRGIFWSWCSLLCSITTKLFPKNEKHATNKEMCFISVAL